MGFYDNFLRLCTIRHVSPSRAANDIGVSNATATHWSQGSIPRPATIVRLCEYFGCAPSDLLDPSDKLNRTQLELIQRALDDEAKKITPELPDVNELLKEFKHKYSLGCTNHGEPLTDQQRHIIAQSITMIETILKTK